jgi:glycosyltransferase involved in cell wall biosynthesis
VVADVEGRPHRSRSRVPIDTWGDTVTTDTNGTSHAMDQVATGSATVPQQRTRIGLESEPHPQVGASGSSSTQLTVTLVIPTLNEAGNIRTVLGQLGRYQDIVLVDGQSDDGTVELARELRPDLTVLQRPPAGKGDALRAGFAAARGDVIVILDADGSMDPAEIDLMVSTIGVGFDLVKGSRNACGGGSHDLTHVRHLGNAALCATANLLFGVKWTDLCYGYLAFRRECLPRLALDADGFEIEAQILTHAALAGLRIAEVPSVELPRFAGESHLNARRDGIRILRTLLRTRFTPRARRDAAALRANPWG